MRIDSRRGPNGGEHRLLGALEWSLSLFAFVIACSSGTISFPVKKVGSAGVGSAVSAEGPRLFPRPVLFGHHLESFWP